MYKHHRFPSAIIQHAVWLYHRFNLSHRDIEDFLAERGIAVSYEAIRLWCNKFGTEYAKRRKGKHQGFGDTFYIDEVLQLITNFGIGLLCLWLVWLRNKVQLASVLVGLVMGGVLIAHGFQDVYGGSILSGNISKTILGVELAAAAAGLAVIMAVGAALLESRSKA